MNEEAKKKVDETWKDQISKEKQEVKDSSGTYQEPNFMIFLSSLGMQAMIALGKLENPLTKKLDKNPDQARFLIDTLGIIKEKTVNNLNKEEADLLEEYLFNLRMVYVQEKGQEQGGK